MTKQRPGTPNGARGLSGLAGPRVVLAAALVLIVGVAGTAVARWGGAGAGTGTAAAGADLPVTIEPGIPSAQLYPGGQADVLLTISNPNAYDVQIDALSRDASQGSGGYAVDALHDDCLLTTLTFTTQTNGGSGWAVPAAAGGVDGSLPLTLSDALAMGADAANACQGASFTVYLRVDA